MDKKNLKYLITIDGPVASGKSSLSSSLAERLGWKWLSTGVFYRGIAYLALSQKITQEKQIIEVIIKQPWSVQMTQKKTCFIYKNQDITDKIYTDEVDAFASTLASFPLVRETLLSYQQNCFRPLKGGLVVEGRDCGTRVFPFASLKIYLMATQEIRAKRRASQRNLRILSQEINLQAKRDDKDINRKDSPLKQAKGALIIDTGEMKFDDIVEKVYNKSCELFY